MAAPCHAHEVPEFRDKNADKVIVAVTLSLSPPYLGVLGLLALGIHRLLLRFGLLESLARFFQLLGDLVGRGEFLALGLLSVFLGEKIVQVRHGDAMESGWRGGGATGEQKALRRARTCECGHAKNTLDHGLIAPIVVFAVAVHMGLPPPEDGSAGVAGARVKRAPERSRRNECRANEVSRQPEKAQGKFVS